MKKNNLLIVTIFVLCTFSCSKTENDLIKDSETNQNPIVEETPIPEGEEQNPMGDNPSNYFRFTTYQTSTADPFDVNVLFQVSDSMYRGVPNLNIGNLRVTENDEESPIDESKAILLDKNTFDLKMKTALLIDVSNSIQTDFESLKNELKLLIDAALPYQEIAIYSFSSTTELVLDYSKDKAQLKSAIDNLKLGSSSTDLYGAVVTAANSFENGFIVNEVSVGNLIIFTDGDDTQASNTFVAAKEALTNKSAYVVGLSSADLDEDNIRNLFGNSFYFASETIGSVNENFVFIQAEIENVANSVYVLNYETPKRGENNHYLKIYHQDNINTGADQYAVGEFISTGFYEPSGPSKAVLISPALNEEITLYNTCNVEFTIGRSIDPDVSDKDNITYQLLIGETESNMIIVDEFIASGNNELIYLYSSGKLEFFKEYFWKVITKDNDDSSLDISTEVNKFYFEEAIYNGNITLNNQHEVDKFCYNKILGDLIIVSDSNTTEVINNLEGLYGLTLVGGNLIVSNTEVTTLNGLNNLQKSNYISFYCKDEFRLLSLEGLENIKELNALQVTNSSITSLNGLNNIEKLGQINLTNNLNLESLLGLEKLQEPSSGTWFNSSFEDNIKLANYCGLPEHSFTKLNSSKIKGNLFNPSHDDLLNGNCQL